MEPTTGTVTQTSRSSFFINRNFGLLWLGQAISSLGDTIYFVTLGLWIATIIAKNQLWAPAAVGGLTIAATLPTFALGGLFAGVFVDRWDKRLTMIRMDAIRAVLIFLLIPLTGLVHLPLVNIHISIYWQLGSIYSVVLAASICSRFFSPARFTILSEILPEAHRARASAMEQTSTSLVRILGPFLATPLFFLIGIQWVLIVNALSFVFSFVAILAVQVSNEEREKHVKKEKTTFLGELKAGLNFYRQSRFLQTLLISILIVTLGAGAFDTLLIFFFQKHLHAPINLYTTLPMAAGVGWIMGAILSARLVKHMGPVRIFWLGLYGVGISQILFARQDMLWPALALLCLLGLSLGALNTVAGPLLMHIIPQDIMGRVISIFDTSQICCQLISASVAGMLGTLLTNFHITLLRMPFGAYDTIYIATGTLFLLGASYALINLRGLNIP